MKEPIKPKLMELIAALDRGYDDQHSLWRIMQMGVVCSYNAYATLAYRKMGESQKALDYYAKACHASGRLEELLGKIWERLRDDTDTSTDYS